jgi:hypothetical protein
VKEPHEEVLDLLYQALDKLKKLPFIEYSAPKVVGAMINVETTIETLENAKRNND